MSAVKPLKFREEDHEMSVQYSNRGEPFRDGVEFCFSRSDFDWVKMPATWVLLDRSEVQQLRDKLTEFLNTLE